MAKGFHLEMAVHGRDAGREGAPALRSPPITSHPLRAPRGLATYRFWARPDNMRTTTLGTSSAMSMRSALLLALLVTPGLHGAPDSLDALKEELDSFVRPFIERQIVVGLSIGILQDGQRLTMHYGQREAGQERPPGDDTVYEIGSISKAFTGILLADAVRRGEVALDEPLTALLPREVNLPRAGDLNITLLHLATHSSGLPRMPSNFAPADAANPYADYSTRRMYDFLASHTLARRPGESHEYSNLGAALLGHALELRAGRPYEQLLVDRICQPLGMNDTRVTLNESMRGRLARGHDADGEPVSNWDLPAFAGAGGIRSTVQDMLKFLAANLEPDKSDLGAAIRDSHEKRFPVQEPVYMGLGWFTNGGDIWHNGLTGGYHSFAWVHPNTRNGVVVLTNTSTMRVDPLGWRIAKRVIGNMEYKQPIPLPPVPIDVPAEKLELLAGSYAISPAFVLTVSRDGDRLYVQATAQPRFRVYAESPLSFFYKVVEARIVFEPGEDGRATRLTLHQNGLKMPAIRIKNPPDAGGR
jgi:serine-type D-Ala-D-Ala carboxypeptidase/endopeptidase